MRPLTVVIIDDEPPARAAIQKLLEPERDVSVVGQAGDGRSARELLLHLSPDLVFLDVHLPDVDGLEFYRSLPAVRRPAVIFTTAHDAFALRAFELQAVDYLLKPYPDERFREALGRLRARLRQSSLADFAARLDALLRHLSVPLPAPRPAAPVRPGQIAVKSGGDIHVFKPEQIKWVEGQGDYLKIHGVAGSALVRETMTAFLHRVPADRFVRVHKSAIVNVSFIRRLEPIYAGDYRLELADGTVVRVSRSHRRQLRTVLGE